LKLNPILLAKIETRDSVGAPIDGFSREDVSGGSRSQLTNGIVFPADGRAD